jgi:hypothetical protein
MLLTGCVVEVWSSKVPCPLRCQQCYTGWYPCRSTGGAHGVARQRKDRSRGWDRQVVLYLQQPGRALLCSKLPQPLHFCPQNTHSPMWPSYRPWQNSPALFATTPRLWQLRELCLASSAT